MSGDVKILEVTYFENRKHRVRITYRLDDVTYYGPAGITPSGVTVGDPSVYLVEHRDGADNFRDWYSAKVRTVTAARAAELLGSGPITRRG